MGLLINDKDKIVSRDIEFELELYIFEKKDFLKLTNRINNILGDLYI